MLNNKSLQSFIEHAILMGLIGNLVLPSLKIDNFGIGVITISSFALCAVILFTVLINKVRLNLFFGIYLVILLGMYFSIIHAYIFLNVDKSSGDYMELFRYFQVLPFLYLASYVDYSSFERKLYIYSTIAVVLICAIGFLEITNLFNATSILGQIYSTPLHTQAMLSSTKRIVVSGSDPNVGGLIVVFFLTLSMMYKGKGLLSNALIRFVLFVVLVFTQSRTILLGSLFTLSLYLLMMSRFGMIKKIAISAIFVFIILSTFMFIDISYITDGMKLASVGENESLNVRFENYINASLRFQESPIFGWGPSKAIHSTIIDSEYALIIQRYGLLGIFSYFIFYTSIFLKIQKLRQFNHTGLFDFINLSLLIMLIGVFVMSTNNFVSGYQSVSIPILILVGLISLSNSRYKTIAK